MKITARYSLLLTICLTCIACGDDNAAKSNNVDPPQDMATEQLDMATSPFDMAMDKPDQSQKEMGQDDGVIENDMATPGPMAPSWPQGAMLKVIPTESGGVRLDWPSAQSDTLIAYDLFQDDVRIKRLTASVQTFQTDPLDAMQMVQFRVVAKDSQGLASGALVASYTQMPQTIVPRPFNASYQASVSTLANELTQGPNPSQLDVQPDALEPRRIATLTGKILDNQGNPVSGVRVHMHNSPGLGYTLTNAQGEYTVALNGGGEIHLDFTKDQYMRVQRTLSPGWGEVKDVADVVMLKLDPKVTTIDMSQAAPSAQSSMVQDQDGQRQVTLIFKQGTTAEMTLAGGAKKPVQKFDVRMTEYTVGDEGASAMPAQLPTTTSYTYAANLTLDEALQEGAERVDFSQPVAIYINNFLDIKGGEDVPLGYYDFELAKWVAEPNGRVVKILSINGGQAQLDVTGDDVAESTMELDAFGINAAERTKLATLFASGESLWRTTITHFTPIDCNWPFSCPDGPCEEPDGDITQDEGDTDCSSGSIVECRKQVLREAIPVAGTNMALHYSTYNQYGYAAKRMVKIDPFGSRTTLPSYVGIGLGVGGVYVGGEPKFFEGTPKELVWDGKLRDGRRFNGGIKAQAGLAFCYILVRTRSGGGGFGQPSSSRVAVSLGGQPVRGLTFPVNAGRCPESFWQFTRMISGPGLAIASLSKTFNVSIDAWNIPSLQLGGWSLTPWHHYDPTSGTLHRGDGTRQLITALGSAVQDSVGVLNKRYTLRDYDANHSRAEASLQAPRSLATGPDGSVYITDSQLHRVLRAMPDGTIRSIAGGPEDRIGGSVTRGYNGDGRAAINTLLNFPLDVAVSPDGRVVYIADTANDRIRKVDENGVLTTLVGAGPNGDNTSSGFADDPDGAAYSSLASEPQGVAVSPNGEVYYSDTGNDCIRAITPNGQLYTVVGQCRQSGSSDDGVFAAEANITKPTDLVFDERGGLYFIEDGLDRVRHVSRTGVLSTPVEWPVATFGKPKHLTFDTKTSSVLVTIDAGIVQMKSGKITRIAGSGQRDLEQGVFSALSVNISPNVRGVAVSPSGDIYYAEFSGNVVRRIERTFLDNAGRRQRYIVPDQSSDLVYVFNTEGRHLETRSSMDDQLILKFHYTPGGLLDRIEDSTGQATLIERGPQGTPVAIRAHNGVRTLLGTTQSPGETLTLTEVKDPLGHVWNMAYFAQGQDMACEGDGSNCEGLMKSIETPDGGVMQFEYDKRGRLTKESSNAGFVRVLRPGTSASKTESIIEEVSTLGRVAKYGQESKTSSRLTWFEDAAGRRTETEVEEGGAATITYPEGLTRRTVMGFNDQFQRGKPTVFSTQLTRPSGKTLRTEFEQTSTLKDPGNTLNLESRISTHKAVAENSERTRQVVYTGQGRSFVETSYGGRSVTSTLAQGSQEVGRIEQPRRHSVEFTYDAQGRPKTETQGDRQVFYTYDSLGYLESMQYRDVSQPMSSIYSVTYENDLLGRVTSRTLTNGDRFEYEWDGVGNLLSAQPASGQGKLSMTYNTQRRQTDTRHPVVQGQAARVQVSHDADNVIKQITLADGRTIDYTFDATTAQPTAIKTPETELTFTQDPTTGQLTQITETNGLTQSFTRDANLLIGDQVQGPQILTNVTYEIDGWQKVASYSIDRGQTIAIQRDDDDQPIQVGQLTLNRDPTHWDLLGTQIDALTTQYDYNLYGERTEATVSHSSVGQLNQWSQTMDLMGRVAQSTWNGNAESYEYDTTGRLKSITRQGLIWAQYTYDNAGNLTQSVEAGETITATYDARNRIQSWGPGRSYEFNEAGQVSAITDTTRLGGKITLSQGAMGHLRGVTLADGTKVDYLIDPQGRRVGKIKGGVLEAGWAYQGIQPVAQINTDGLTVDAQFVYASMPHSPDYMIKGGKTYRFIHDYIGSVRKVVDASTGDVLQEIDYTPFGQVIRDTNPGFQPFGFAGGLTDQDTGLINFGARDYDPVAGRWIALDPAGLEGGFINLYTYANSNPVNFVDPTGRAAWFVPIIIWGVASFAIDAALQQATTGCINWYQASAAGVIGGLGSGLSILATARYATRAGAAFKLWKHHNTIRLGAQGGARITAAQQMSKNAVIGITNVFKTAGVNAGLSAVAGGTTQAVKNGISNAGLGAGAKPTPAFKGVGTAATVGGATGFLGGAAGGAAGAAGRSGADALGGLTERIPADQYLAPFD